MRSCLNICNRQYLKKNNVFLKLFQNTFPIQNFENKQVDYIVVLSVCFINLYAKDICIFKTYMQRIFVFI